MPADDKEKIAEIHEKVNIMSPMVKKLHDKMFVGGNGGDSYSTQISKNTEMRLSIHKRMWTMAFAFVGMIFVVGGRWIWDKIRGL